MSNSDAVAGYGRPHLPSWKRFAGILALFVLLGPLMGAVGVNVIFTVYGVGVEIANGNFGDIARLFWGGIVVGTIVSAIIAYTFGVVSAVGVGLAVAFRDRSNGRISWRAALVAALAFWLLTTLATTAAVPPQELVQWIGALLAGHVLATALTTWIARRVFR